jgi:hypothetical protein
MTKFGAWITASLSHFVLGAGPIFGAPLAVGFAVFADGRGELTTPFLLRIIIVSALGGLAWALMMWPGIRLLARRSRSRR